MGENQLEAYLLSLENADTDNEKFAALLMVAKVTNNEICGLLGKKRILEAIGPKFFSRLLKTKNVPDGCPDCIYKTVAMSILSALCTEADVACSPALLDNVTSFNGIILLDPSVAEEPERQLVDDTFECYSSLCQTEAGRNALTKSKTVSAFSQAIISQVYGCEKAGDLLLYLLPAIGPAAWHGCEPALAQLLRHLAHLFVEDKTATKFILCHNLIIVLSSKPTMSQRGDIAWERDIITGLDSLLRSKLGSNQREMALRLASTVIEVCGVECLLPPRLADCKLFLLIIHLCCVEVRMVLEDPDIQQASVKGKLLTLCYRQLEMIIAHLTAAGSPSLNERQILQLHSAMVGAYSAIIHYLRRIADGPVMQWHGIVLATVRVLAAWLAEETSALQEEIYELLPFILRISKMCIPPDDYIDPSRRQAGGGDQQGGAGERDTEHTDLDNMELNINNNKSDTDASGNGIPADTQHELCNGNVTPLEASLGHMNMTEAEDQSCSETDTIPGPNSVTDKVSHLPAEESTKTIDCDTVNTCNLDVHSQNPGDSTREDGISGASSVGPSNSVMSQTEADAQLRLPSDEDSNPATVDQLNDDSSTTSKQSNTASLRDESKPDDLCSSDPTLDQTNPQLSKLSDLVESHPDDMDRRHDGILTATEPRTEFDLHDLHIRVDILRFLLPGLCHLTAEDTPRAILVQQGALSLLDLYMWRQWARFSHDTTDREVQSGLVILCNIFLNLVIVEPSLVTENAEFSHILLLVVKTANQLEFESEHVVLWCHMLTLGLMLMRALSRRTEEFLETDSICQFFQSVIRFLSGTYVTEQRANGSSSLAQADLYTPVWDQMSQTWFLSMQAFCACIPLYDSLPSIVLKVGWIPSLLKTLLQVKGHGVEEETGCCFQLLLTTFANRNRAARTVIKEKRGPDVAKMYKWKELADILHR